MSRNKTLRFLARAAFVACAALSLTGSALVDPSAIGKGGTDYKTAQVQRGTLLGEMTASGSVYRPTYVDIRCKVYDVRVAEVPSVYLTCKVSFLHPHT